MIPETLDAEWNRFSKDLAEYWDSLRDEDFGHDDTSLERVTGILSGFIAQLKLALPVGASAIEKAVLDCVIDLNTLNRRYDNGLLETDERELLCEFLNTCAERSGIDLSTYEYGDVTMSVREF